MLPVKVGSTFKFQNSGIKYEVLNIANKENKVQANIKMTAPTIFGQRTRWFPMWKIKQAFRRYPTELKY